MLTEEVGLMMLLIDIIQIWLREADLLIQNTLVSNIWV
nr:MAG TPA: hypothetical protein [Caudoviricetes sp.]